MGVVIRGDGRPAGQAGRTSGRESCGQRREWAAIRLRRHVHRGPCRKVSGDRPACCPALHARSGRALDRPRRGHSRGTLLALHPHRAPASSLAPLITRRGKPGFVVSDMTDVDDFLPIDGTEPPAPIQLSKPNGRLDSRTPALWIGNRTGRDGPDHRNAPKIGWCWAGNRHTWLGFAAASTRAPLAA
ncbi:DUF5701 family protein [Pseudactinotalea sp. HY160]|uniref:DUF5701 family protein n=1 Tax=Pseudactinotalea sp. HY160 TaxID=2654490 RepID=UPI00351BDE7F